MGKDEGFRAFVEDQLEGIERLDVRPMFGGYGLYCGDVFFGIIFHGQLFFKTSEDTRGRYVKRGMKPFRPSAKQTLKSYYEVPADVLDETDVLVAWAREAVSCQHTRQRRSISRARR